MSNKTISFSVLISIALISFISCKQKLTEKSSGIKVTTAPTTNSGPLIAIGESFGGGVIFYVDSTKKHGLIAAASQMLQARWGCMGKTIGGTSAAVGTGQANTLAILKGCDSVKCAARLCDELVLNGFSDWYLPSKAELNLLYLSKGYFRNIKTDYYWSSTESDAAQAECQDFYDGHHLPYEKNKTYFVRAVRSF